MEKKVGRMPKFYSIFSIFLTLTAISYSQELQKDSSSKMEDSSSVVIKEQSKNIYPGKPLIMSLILPGAGQYYNKSPFWKTASFLGLEISGLLAWNHFQNEADKWKDKYKDFADRNWTLDNWVMNVKDPNNNYVYEDRYWSQFQSLSKFSGTHDMHLIITGALANELNVNDGYLMVSSDSLDQHSDWILNPDYRQDIVVVRDRHFYENIGKYDQFVGGWNDARDSWYWEEKDVGDSTEIVIKTPMKKDYIDWRYESNNMLSAAKYAVTLLMFNHVISGIESVWTHLNKNNNQDSDNASLQSEFNLVYDPTMKFGVSGIKFAVYF